MPRPRERVAVLAVATIVAIWTTVSPLYDFRVYWDAGRHLREAGWGAVYDPGSLTPFKYHPAFALAFAPWSLLPWVAAKVAWGMLTGLLLFDAGRRWVRHWRLDAIAIAMGFVGVVHAMTWQTKLGNVTILMLWCLTVALTTGSAPIRAALYGLLLTLKPYWLVLLLPWAFGRKWGTMAGAALAVLGISLVPALGGLSGASLAYRSWAATLTAPSELHNFPKLDNQGWYGLLSRHAEALGSALPWIWIAGSGLVAGLWLLAWRRMGHVPPESVTEARRELSVVPLFLWAAPLSWMHHQVLLWPLLSWLWMAGRSDRATKGVWVAVWALLNGTGRAIAGRAFSRTLLRLGLPILSYPLLIWWAARGAPGAATDPAGIQVQGSRKTD